MKPEVITVRRIDYSIPALALLAPLLLFVPIGHDQIWQVWIGREMLHGSVLYKDIIEVNPPLWFWMAVPLAGIGELFGIELRYLVSGLFLALIALSLWLIPRRYRLPALAAFALLPLINYGQREHFTLIATVPYAFLIAQRVRGETPRHPVIIGMFAALGFALKHYFVLVPIALELLAWKAPRIRPETIALVVCAVLYAVAVPIFAPHYLSDVIPEVMIYYPYFESTIGYWHFNAALLFGALGALLGWRKGSPESRALAICALAFIPAVMLQAKGWSYQTIAVRGFLLLAIAAELMRERKNPFADAVLVGAALLTFWPVALYDNGWRPETESHLKGLTPGTTITAFTSNPSSVWPMVEEHKLRWVSRQFCTWQVHAAIRRPEFIPALRKVIERDMERRPQIIIVDRRPFVDATLQAALPPLTGYKLRRRTVLLDSYERS